MSDLPQVQWEDLKAALQAEVDTALQDVMQSVNNAASGVLIAASEEGVRDAVATLRTAMFQKAIQLRVDAIEKQLAVPVDPLTSKKKRNKGRQATTILTINGRVTFQRRWWHGDSTGSAAPLDAILHADNSNMTPGVREMCCRLNIGSTSFDRTAADLWRTAQVEISGETVRKTVIAEGVRVQQVQSTGELPTSFTAADCGVDKQRGSVVITRTSSEIPTPSFEQDSELGESNTPTEITLAADATSKGMSAHEDNSPLPTNTVTRMYLGVDGVMVPTVTDTEKAKRREGVLKRRAARALLDPQKAAAILPLAPRTTGTDCRYKEFKVIEFHSESQEHQHISLSAARRPEVGAIVKQMSDQLGFKTCDEKVANVDGATWIPEQLEQSEVEVDGLGLDFYHLSEQVHSARRAVFGEESSAGQEWATRQMHGFKHKGYDEVVPELMTWRSALRGQKRGAATKLVNYVTDRRAMIQYPEFLAEGWQIGSGATESRCRTSTRRLKVSGARWDMPNAAAVAALANLADSHQWPLYWPQLKPVNQTT